MVMQKLVAQSLAIAFLAAIGFAGLGSYAVAEDGKAQTLTGAGCKTEYLLIRDLARGYEHRTRNTVIPKKTGNKVALKLLASDNIDFAFTCKPYAKVLKKLKLNPQKTNDWQSVEIAKDPIVVIVNRKNKMVNISMAQLKDVFSGKVKNWKELGGTDMPIKISHLDASAGSGVLTVFKEIVLGRKKDGTLNSLTPEAHAFSGPKNVGAFVAQNRNAIGFIGLNSYEKRYGAVLNINRVAPNRENIINHKYPLAATYHIVYDKNNDAKVKPFLNYISSDEGISVANQSFVSNVKKLQKK